MVLEQVRVVERNGIKVVVKEFADLPSMKWAISLPFRPLYPFALKAGERLRRELEFLTSPHEWIRTPKVLGVDFERKVLEREYVEGTPLSELEPRDAAGMLGRILAAIHGEGWVLGDTKPSNFIVYSESEDVVYVLDAEQSLRSHNELYMSWDVVAALMFLGIYNPVEAVVKSIDMLYTFSNSYKEAGGNLKIVDGALKVLRTVKRKT